MATRTGSKTAAAVIQPSPESANGPGAVGRRGARSPAIAGRGLREMRHQVKIPFRPLPQEKRGRSRTENASPDPSVLIRHGSRGDLGQDQKVRDRVRDNRTDDRARLSGRVLPRRSGRTRRNDRSRCCAARSKIKFNPLPARRPGDPTAARPEQPDLLIRL